jgi:hypothetical protein
MEEEFTGMQRMKKIKNFLSSSSSASSSSL